jgi:hypothetical protein
MNIYNHIQNIFGCSSANFHNHPELWMANIELYIPQVYEFIMFKGDYKKNITNIESFNTNNTILRDLFRHYGSDKAGQVNYWMLYTNKLSKYIDKNIRLLEVGLGTNNPSLISTMGIGMYKCGSSLRSFRDFLPNAKIYGADIDKECLFSENNIETYFVDQLNYSTFNDLYDNCGNQKFDIIIDDGLHSIGANLNTLLFALNNINDNGLIIIEDIPIEKIKGYEIVDYILSSMDKYITTFVTYNNGAGFIYMVELK